MNRRYALSFFVLAFIVGCSSRPVTLIPSSSPVAPGTRGTIRASGSSCQWSLFSIIPLSGPPHLDEALQEAKDDADVDVLTDITVEETSRWLILFGRQCTRVEGLGIKK